VQYCVKRTSYTYAVRFTQYDDLYTYLRPTELGFVVTISQRSPSRKAYADYDVVGYALPGRGLRND